MDKFLNNNDVITISINFIPEKIEVDYMFNSNLKRSENIEQQSLNKIFTTNIQSSSDSENEYIINYFSLLNESENAKDNAGLMLINLLIKLKSNKVFLIGFDGYGELSKDN